MKDIEVSPTEIIKRKADGRGRVTLGSEYSHQTITVAIVVVED